MDEGYFAPLSGQAWHTLRLLNYPPVANKSLAREGQARAGAHSGAITIRIERMELLLNVMTDYGSLTFVFQDDVSFVVHLDSSTELPCTGGRSPSTEPSHTKLYTCSSDRE